MPVPKLLFRPVPLPPWSITDSSNAKWHLDRFRYFSTAYGTIQYDTRCYFNERSEADIGLSQLNNRTETTTKSG